MRMMITIQDLCFETIIGILEIERLIPQKVILNAKITYDYSGDNFVNYALLVEHFRSHMQERCYGVLEDALQDLARTAFQDFPNIYKMTLSIQKPDIIGRCHVGVRGKFKNTQKFLSYQT